MIKIAEKANREFSLASLSLDLMPLLDIIFIVLVFLLLTANSRLTSLPMELPQTSEQAAAMAENPLVISLALNGPDLWGLDERKFSSKREFERALLAAVSQSPQRPIALLSDRNVPVQRMLDLFALLQKAGVAVTEIALEPGAVKF